MQDKRIGTYHLKEDKVFRNTFECAAWYEDVLVKAGDYPIAVYNYRIYDDGRINGHCMAVYVEMPGVVVEDEFGARIGGMPIGEYDNHQNTGKPSSHSLFAYMHSVAKDILDGDGAYELDAGYEARQVKFTNYRGEKVTTYGIFEVRRE